MNYSTFFILISAFICGQALQLLFVKIPSLKKNFAAANKKMYFKEWWDCDWNLILGMPFIMILLLLLLKELVLWQPVFGNYMVSTFAGAGFAGSQIVMHFGSSFGDGVIKLLSAKANIADALTGGTTSIQDTIEKGTAVLGIDISKSPVQ